MQLIIANACGLTACILMVWVGYERNKSKLLIIQIVQALLFAAGNGLLGSYSGMAVCLVGVAIDALVYKNKYTHPFKYALTLLCLIIPLSVNRLGILGTLPIISTVTYALCVDTPDMRKFKLMMVSTTALWAVHDFGIGLYIDGVFDILTIITGTITYIHLTKHPNSDENNQKCWLLTEPKHKN